MPSQLIEAIKPYIPEQLREIDAQHAIRLITIVGGYYVFRTAANKFLANRQLKQQIAQDREGKDEQKMKELIEDPDAKSSGADDGSWGWGKKTRRNVKRQEKILQEHLENLQAGGVDDDKDIEDLLED